ncbi:MAG: 2Fe-2S iron-sulfur cluster-binding protein [Actinomycetota bacterium]|nr:2Fe-2S iron-sulfur cluster-binding protein [Actinomycetota bacterium]
MTLELPDGGTRTVSVKPGQHILDAARCEGIELPSACEIGWDLACACRVLEGDWDNRDARRYFVADRDAGFILICTATPRSDMRIRTHQRDEMREHRLQLGLPTPRGNWGRNRATWT